MLCVDGSIPSTFLTIKNKAMNKPIIIYAPETVLIADGHVITSNRTILTPKGEFVEIQASFSPLTNVLHPITPEKFQSILN